MYEYTYYVNYKSVELGIVSIYIFLVANHIIFVPTIFHIIHRSVIRDTILDSERSEECI